MSDELEALFNELLKEEEKKLKEVKEEKKVEITPVKEEKREETVLPEVPELKEEKKEEKKEITFDLEFEAKTETKKEATSTSAAKPSDVFELPPPTAKPKTPEKQEIKPVKPVSKPVSPPSKGEIIPSPQLFEKPVQQFEVPEKEKYKGFEIEEEAGPPCKYVILIYGDKGTGKTTTALAFPGVIAVLSFDKKSAIIKATRYKGDPRIHVFNAVKYMDYKDPQSMLESANKTYDYIDVLLDYIAEKIKPDWIVIDGAEIFQQICEWRMRYRHNIEPFAGIRNLNLWKERRQYLRHIHNKAYNIAKRGIIYTTYTTKDELVVEGELITKKDVPKWIDVLIFETDIVLKTEIDPTTRRFYVKVVTSKNDAMMPTGGKFDVTDKNFIQVLKERGYGHGL